MKEVIIALNGIIYREAKKVVKKYKYKYELLKKYSFHTSIKPRKAFCNEGCFVWVLTTGKVVIAKGYAWNGSDFIWDTDACMRASLEHDALCQLYNAGLLEDKWIKIINDRYRDTCKADGMGKIQYRLRRLGLKIYWWFKA